MLICTRLAMLLSSRHLVDVLRGTLRSRRRAFPEIRHSLANAFRYGTRCLTDCIHCAAEDTSSGPSDAVGRVGSSGGGVRHKALLLLRFRWVLVLVRHVDCAEIVCLHQSSNAREGMSSSMQSCNGRGERENGLGIVYVDVIAEQRNVDTSSLPRHQ